MSLEKIREYISYDPTNGLFTWLRKPSARVEPGATAGTLHSSGAIYIGFRRRFYKAHRLAWWFVYGEWPLEIDHKNRNRADNRIENLRAATHAQNNANSRCRNASGYKGAYFIKGRKKWLSNITAKNRTIFLGYFDTAQDAARAYDQAAIEHFGEFAGLNFPVQAR